MPAIAHAANASGFVLADDAAWCEHLAAGGVYTEPQIVNGLDGNGGECVELASDSDAILVRDTTNRNGGTFTFTPEAWVAFATALK